MRPLSPHGPGRVEVSGTQVSEAPSAPPAGPNPQKDHGQQPVGRARSLPDGTVNRRDWRGVAGPQQARRAAAWQIGPAPLVAF
jgi:hypothetical protein